MSLRWIALLGVVASMGCGDGDHEAEKNFARGLVSFGYSLDSGLGFCPAAGAVYRAEIRSRDDGTLVVTGSVLEVDDRDEATCIPQVNSDGCFVARALALRALDPREVADVAATFTNVKIHTDDEADCSSTDPCVVKRFTWTNDVAENEVTVDARDGSCAPRLSAAEARDVTALVSRLLLGPR